MAKHREQFTENKSQLATNLAEANKKETEATAAVKSLKDELDLVNARLEKNEDSHAEMEGWRLRKNKIFQLLTAKNAEVLDLGNKAKKLRKEYDNFTKVHGLTQTLYKKLDARSFGEKGLNGVIDTFKEGVQVEGVDAGDGSFASDLLKFAEMEDKMVKRREQFTENESQITTNLAAANKKETEATAAVKSLKDELDLVNARLEKNEDSHAEMEGWRLRKNKIFQLLTAKNAQVLDLGNKAKKLREQHDNFTKVHGLAQTLYKKLDARSFGDKGLNGVIDTFKEGVHVEGADAGAADITPASSPASSPAISPVTTPTSVHGGGIFDYPVDECCIQ